MAKTIVAFGHFGLAGARSWVIRTGLEAHGWRVRLCRTEAKGLIGKYRSLWRAWKEHARDADAMYVPFAGQYLLPLAWLLARKKRIPLVLDALISLYDTEVYDRRKIARWHPKAWVLWLTDWLTCHLPDVVLLDTEEHVQYFVDAFGADPRNMLAVPVGCRTDLFGPVPLTEREDGSFQVLFYGTYIPLQGIDTIVRAAALLRDREPAVQFTLIGAGQTYPAIRKLADDIGAENIRFEQSMPMEALAEHVRRADLCLGIFGTSAKADRVIPTKAYEALASQKPLVTASTTATQRVLRHKETAFLVPPGDPSALAESIVELHRDTSLRRRIAQNGRSLFASSFFPAAAVELLARRLRENLAA